MNVHMRIITRQKCRSIIIIKGGNDTATLTGLDSYDDNDVAVIRKSKRRKRFLKKYSKR